MSTVNVHQAKTHLSRLLKKVEHGEEVIIARDGTPVARLVALARERVFGDLVGKMIVPDAFFEPLPEEDLAVFGPPTATTGKTRSNKTRSNKTRSNKTRSNKTRSNKTRSKKAKR